MKHRLWPFEDHQPVGLTDLLLTSVVAGTVLWPPFLGVAQCLLCFERFPRPFSAEFYLRIVLLLVATGAVLGLFSGLALVVGLYYRKRWLWRIGPYLIAAVLVGAQSWAFPQTFADLENVQILWRGDGVRALGGAALALPAAWMAVALTLKTAAAHTHREHLRPIVPRELR